MKIFPGIIVRRPYRWETYGIAERAVRRVTEGTSAALLQSRLDEKWCADSTKCYTCEDLPWNHCTSTPHHSDINGTAERAVRRIKEGTSAILLQSGLDENWWADSMECYCHLRNIQDRFSDGKTLYERRFGEPFKDPSFRLAHWLNIIQYPRKISQQFGKKVLPGIFLGYVLYAEGI